MLVILNDLGCQFPRLDSLWKESMTQEVIFLDEREMTYRLQEAVFSQLNLLQKSTLFIYPGESAQRVKSLGFNGHFPSREVFAKRIWYPGVEPVVLVHTLEWGINSEIDNVIVIDDVISSGLTVSLVRERNSWKFPRATWYAAAPVTRRDKLPGFKKVFAEVVVKNLNGKKVPINSLSTLITNPDIRQSYFARNFEKGFEQKFLETIG